MIEGSFRHDISLIETNHRGQLAEESIVSVSGVQSESKHSSHMAISIDVDKMHLCLRAVSANGMIGGSMDVPPLQVHGLIVEADRWILCIVFLYPSDSEGWAVLPVIEAPSHILRVVKRDLVVQRQTGTKAKRNW